MTAILMDELTSKTGHPVLQATVDGKTLMLHSKYDPLQEAERLLETYSEKIEEADHVLFYGAGLGYHVNLFFRKYPYKLATVYEPIEEIASLCLAKSKVTKFPLEYLEHYLIETDVNTIEVNMEQLSNIFQQKIVIITFPIYEKLLPTKLKQFISVFKQHVELKKTNLVASTNFAKRWTLNALMNLSKTFEHPNILLHKKQFFKDKPVILVSAGPSLSEEMDNLRTVKEKGLAYIFAVGSANKALILNDIYPDAVCTYDPQQHNYQVFNEINWRQIRTVPMIYGTSVGFETLDHYSGSKFYFVTSQDQLTQNFHKEALPVIDDATTIAIVTLQLLKALEVSQIILVGQNFAFKKNQFYADEIKRYDKEKKEMTDSSIQKQDLIESFEVEDVHGEKVLTNGSFTRMKNNMETYLKNISIPIINTTNGGAAIAGTVYQPLETFINGLEENIVVTDWATKETLDKPFILNEAFAKKFTKDIDAFIKQLDEIKVHFERLEKSLPTLNANQIQRKLEKFDDLFQKFIANTFYLTVIQPIAQLYFEKLKAETNVIRVLDSSQNKAHKVMSIYSYYLAKCKEIYVDISPIVKSKVLMQEQLLVDWKPYEATSGIFQYEGNWDKKQVEYTEEKVLDEAKEEEEPGTIKLMDMHATTLNGKGKFSFKFSGRKLRVLGSNLSEEPVKMTISIENKKHIAIIPASEDKTDKSLFNRQILFEKLNLPSTMHTVTIEFENEEAEIVFLGIEIAKEERAYHIHEVTTVEELEIGKRIRCHYEATYNAVGEFIGLGEEMKRFLPVESCSEPNGDFYFIMVDEIDGEKKLIADRNMQNEISWTTLNQFGFGSNLGITIESLCNINYQSKMNLLYGGDSEEDITNEWNRYVIQTDLDGKITAGSDLVWNWSEPSGTWTNTSKKFRSPNDILMMPVRSRLFANGQWHGKDASRWVLGTTTNINTITSFRPKLICNNI